MYLGICSLVSSGLECNSDGFIRRNVGTCPNGTSFIETDEDCATAAASLGLLDTDPGTDPYPTNPYGCYYKRSTGRLYWNLAGNRTDDDTDRVSLCNCSQGASNRSLSLHIV